MNFQHKKSESDLFQYAQWKYKVLHSPPKDIFEYLMSPKHFEPQYNYLKRSQCIQSERIRADVMVIKTFDSWG